MILDYNNTTVQNCDINYDAIIVGINANRVI